MMMKVLIAVAMAVATGLAPMMQQRPRIDKAKKVVLSLDGGGLRGMVTAQVLEVLETELRAQTGVEDLRLGEVFDLIAGTSTGAVLATYFTHYADGHERKITNNAGESIVLDGSARAAVEFYEKFGRDIFPTVPTWCPSWLAWIAQGRASWGTLHSAKHLDEVLQKAIPTTETLKDLAHRDDARSSLLVTTYDMTYRRPVFFIADRLNHMSRFFALDSMGRAFKDSFYYWLGGTTAEADERWEALKARALATKEKGNWVEGTVPLNFGDTDILSINATYDEPYIRFGASRQREDIDTPLWKIARCSSSAPVFFEPMVIEDFFKTTDGRTGSLVACDGGVIANNPAETAYNALKTSYLVKSKTTLEPKDIMLLSIGCGQRFRTVTSSEAQNTKSYLSWLTQDSGNILDVLMNANAKVVHSNLNAIFATNKIADQYLRIQFSANDGGAPAGTVRDDVRDALGQMDNPKNIEKYAAVGNMTGEVFKDEIHRFVKTMKISAHHHGEAPLTKTPTTTVSD